MAVLFAGSVVAWAVAARAFGPRALPCWSRGDARLSGVRVMFHEVSSEPLFAAAFWLWALLVVRASPGSAAARFALAGPASHCSHCPSWERRTARLRCVSLRAAG